MPSAESVAGGLGGLGRALGADRLGVVVPAVDLGYQAGHLARDVRRGEPDLRHDLLAGGVVEEPLGDAEVPQWHVHTGVPQRLGDGRTDAAGADVVLDGDHDPVGGGEPGQRRIDRLDPARVDDGGRNALLVEKVGDLQAHRCEGTDGHQQDIGPLDALGGLAQHVHPADAPDGLDGRPDRTLGVPHDGGRVIDLDGLPQLGADLVGVARRGDPQTRDDLQDRHVPHAVVRGAVGAGDTGPVQDEGDPALVQRHVHQHLVEGAVEEGGVDGEDRVQAAGGHTGRGDRGVLLGDADVVDAVGEGLGELVQSDGLQHGRRDGDDVVPLLAELDHLVTEDGGPVLAARGERQAGVGVDLADGVEAVRLVLEGGLVAAALFGEAVDDDRAAEALGARQGGLQRLDVVAVDRADVLQAQVLEHALRRDEVLQALLGAVQGLVQRLAHDGRALQQVLAAGQEALVAVRGAQRGQVVGEAADGRGVGALVVVHDDDERAVLGGGDVVERLPGHTAGQRAVADDRGDPVVRTADLVGLRDALGPAQHRGGVAVLDDVMGGLGAGGVAGQAALGLELAEVLTAGEKLVDVGLVPGVEEHLVLGRVEDTVQGDGQLDHTEVRAEVSAGLGHLVDKEGTDLPRQLLELLRVQSVQIARSPDTGQQRPPAARHHPGRTRFARHLLHPCLLAACCSLLAAVDRACRSDESNVASAAGTPGPCDVCHSGDSASGTPISPAGAHGPAPTGSCPVGAAAVERRPVRSGPAGCFLRAAGDRVDHDGGEQHRAGDHVLDLARHAEQVQALLDRLDDQHAQQRGPDLAAAAEEAGAADDGRRDDVHQGVAGAQVLGGTAGEARDEQSAEGGEHAGDGEDADPDLVHVDTGPAGRLGVAADREDLPAVGGAPHHEVGDDQHREEQHQGQRQTAGAGRLVQDVGDHEGDHRDHAGPQQDLAERPGRQLGGLAAAALQQQRAPVGEDRDQRQAVAGALVLEVVAGEVLHQAAGRRVDGALVAHHPDLQAAPAEEAGQRDDEGRHTDFGEKEPVQGADGQSRDDGDQDREPVVDALGDAEDGPHGRADTRHRADRQVDLAEQQHEDDADGHDAEAGGVDTDVREAVRGQEAAVLELEDDRDDDQADDDRQRAQLTTAHPALEVAEIAGEALLTDEQTGVDGGRLGGVGGGCLRRRLLLAGWLLGEVTHAPTSFFTWSVRALRRVTALSEAPVIAAMISSWEVPSTSKTPLLRPSRSTATRSATACTSAMLWLMRMTPRPRSRSRSTRSRTCAVCSTPRAAVGSSRMTTFGSPISARAIATTCR
uniref:Dehydrogenase n=1 Tax=Streptomyces auratus AGR0001 TaxID=1160718 RepID=J1RUT9_9ACTN